MVVGRRRNSSPLLSLSPNGAPPLPTLCFLSTKRKDRLVVSMRCATVRLSHRLTPLSPCHAVGGGGGGALARRCLALRPAAASASPFATRRWESTTAKAPSSAVNIRDFTLNEAVVKRDLENMARWNELSAAIDTARAAKDPTQVLAEVAKGLAMLEELGVDSAPIQCEALLCMEGAQAHYVGERYSEALALARRARTSLTSDGKPELQDRAQIAEIDQFIGFVLCKDGREKEAQEVLEKVLHWIDVDARSAMPMQAVAALQLRRSVLTGIGQSLTLQAKKLEAAGSVAEAKERYGKALDILIEGLDKHIDESDFSLVKSSLEGILQCFEGLQDGEQAVTTCRKYISWCSRHGDAEGVEQGKRMLSEICERTNRPPPPCAPEGEGGDEGAPSART